jgi:DNA-binding CsgD family transcriptional regulator
MEVTPERDGDRPPELLLPSLSITERRVGSLVAAGYGQLEISRRLLLSPQLVDWTVAKLCRTFAAATPAELAAQLRALSSS